MLSEELHAVEFVEFPKPYPSQLPPALQPSWVRAPQDKLDDLGLEVETTKCGSVVSSSFAR